MNKQHIKTSTGFECDVDKRVLDDFGFIKMLGAMVSGDEDQALPALANLPSALLGKADEKRLLKHVEKDGYSSVIDVTNEVNEIIEILKADEDVKN